MAMIVSGTTTSLLKSCARQVATLTLFLLLGLWDGCVEGQTWQVTSAPAAKWTALACSADGNTIYAAATPYAGVPALLYRSTNGGIAWQPTTAPTQTFNAYNCVSCSADGKKILAAADGIYLSRD